MRRTRWNLILPCWLVAACASTSPAPEPSSPAPQTERAISEPPREAPVSELDEEHDEFRVAQIPSNEEIGEKIREDLSDIQACFNAEYRSNRVACPPVQLNWKHQPDGTMADLSVTSDRGSSALSECIHAVAERWDFPANDGSGNQVSYPLQLQCGG